MSADFLATRFIQCLSLRFIDLHSVQLMQPPSIGHHHSFFVRSCRHHPLIVRQLHLFILGISNPRIGIADPAIELVCLLTLWVAAGFHLNGILIDTMVVLLSGHTVLRMPNTYKVEHLDFDFMV